jgi:aminoglycoside phosphotransferase (APT) family kinase protein
VIVRIPLNKAAGTAEQNNAHFLEHLRRVGVPQSLYPAPLARGEVDGVWYSAEEKAAGTPLVKLLRIAGTSFDHLAAVERVLGELQAASPERALVCLEGDVFEAYVGRLLPGMLATVEDATLREHAAAFFRKQLYGASTTTGIAHGDFGARNIFVQPGHAPRLIDWESAQLNGLPILDAVNYLASAHLAHRPGDKLVDLVSDLTLGRSPVPGGQAFLSRCFDALGTGGSRQIGWVCLTWLNGIARRLANTLAFDPLEIDKDVVTVLKAILRTSAA